MDDRVFITLQGIEYYDIFRKQKFRADKDVEIGSTVASNIIIPSNESSITEDYDNGLLSKDEYIDLMITKGFIKEVV